MTKEREEITRGRKRCQYFPQTPLAEGKRLLSHDWPQEVKQKEVKPQSYWREKASKEEVERGAEKKHGTNSISWLSPRVSDKEKLLNNVKWNAGSREDVMKTLSTPKSERRLSGWVRFGEMKLSHEHTQSTVTLQLRLYLPSLLNLYYLKPNKIQDRLLSSKTWLEFST